MKRKVSRILAMFLAMFLVIGLCVPWQTVLGISGIMLTSYAETAPVRDSRPDGAAANADPAAAEDASGNTVSGSADTQYGAEGAEAESGEESAESTAAAASVFWPELDTVLQAGSAIVMDADTGEVLWGQEIHTKRYPASVTKLLTALVVLDHCSMDETVTFHSSAVSNLESGAVTIGTVAGDQMDVKNCLYALLLKSANEVANALAEHVAGSNGDFAVLMNQKAEELGCQDSDFYNPSGLTDERHVTSAYDMGLIGIACMNNRDFMILESEPTRKLSGTQKYPGGLTVTIGHKMRLKDSEYYDSRVTAGKTGFTSAAGNTLVTMAEDNGRRVVAVVLKDKSPAHYTDTKALLDFGLNSFELVKPDLDTLMEIKDLEKQLIAKGAIHKADTSRGEKNELSLSAIPKVTVPRGGGLRCVDVLLDTALDSRAPENAVARLRLSCLGRKGPYVYVLNDYTPPVTESTAESEISSAGERKTEAETEDGNVVADQTPGFRLGPVGWLVVILLLTAVGFVTYLYFQRRAAEKRREERRRKRKERLERLDVKMEQADGAADSSQAVEETGRYARKTGRSAGRTAGASEPDRKDSGADGARTRRKSRAARRSADDRTEEEEKLLTRLGNRERTETAEYSGQAAPAVSPVQTSAAGLSARKIPEEEASLQEAPEKGLSERVFAGGPGTGAAGGPGGSTGGSAAAVHDPGTGTDKALRYGFRAETGTAPQEGLWAKNGEGLRTKTGAVPQDVPADEARENFDNE